MGDTEPKRVGTQRDDQRERNVQRDRQARNALATCPHGLLLLWPCLNVYPSWHALRPELPVFSFLTVASLCLCVHKLTSALSRWQAHGYCLASVRPLLHSQRSKACPVHKHIRKHIRSPEAVCQALAINDWFSLAIMQCASGCSHFCIHWASQHIVFALSLILRTTIYAGS